jgi:hypothetical protein
MSHKADCPFCKAFAVEVPGPPNQEWLWQLPNDSPMKQLEAENEVLRKILWKCRHGGKGGIPVDYQAEVDALLQDNK